jgi:hypothetical protein
MSASSEMPTVPVTCTAFDHDRLVGSGSYVQMALKLKQYARSRSDASILIFDDSSGKQIDFDLRGSDEDIRSRLTPESPATEPETRRGPGRPKLGVVPREITLLPRHWEWLAEQPGGASVTLRRLVEVARRAGPTSKERLRKVQERTYNFMSAMAGNYPGFEEASRALFANNMSRFNEIIEPWPNDVRDHLLRLSTDDQPANPVS